MKSYYIIFEKSFPSPVGVYLLSSLSLSALINSGLRRRFAAQNQNSFILRLNQVKKPPESAYFLLRLNLHFSDTAGSHLIHGSIIDRTL